MSDNQPEAVVDGQLTRLGILEALLFVAEDPLPLGRLQEALGDEDPTITSASVHELGVCLEREGRGLMVQEVAGGFRLATRPEAHEWIQRLQQLKPARLSRPALETLAIVAYRQPITRAEMEKVRGVAVDGVIRTLLERDLIRILGRKAEAGRPIVYGTSTAFLEHFGFKDLGELPTLKEIDELLGTPAPGATTEAPLVTDGEAAGASAEPREEEPRPADPGEPVASVEVAEPPVERADPA
jgi:segregation and condensation protein B